MALALLAPAATVLDPVVDPGSAGAAEGTSWLADRVRLEPVDGSTLAVEGVGDYRGAIEVSPHGGGLAVVNDVALEDYVRGIAEVPTSWPIEAQKAQAIAARSYALGVAAGGAATEFRAVGADICATQACQVYRGVEREHRGGAGRWLAAVDATAGHVLLHHGAPIRALYSSSNGGFSEPGGTPYLPAVEDPDDVAVSPWARWRATWPLDEIAAAFPGQGELVDVNRAGEVLVLRRRQPDGTIVDEGMSGAAARAAFNARLRPAPGLPVPLLSRRFVAWTEGDTRTPSEGATGGRTVVVEGAGFGHLRGMSQYGALGKALRGFAAADILAAYYGGLHPTQLAPEQLPTRIRVALAYAEPSVAVTGTGRFRVVAADGTVLAHLADGRWELRPAAGGVRIVPPAAQGVPAGVDLTAPALDRVRVALAIPAAVALLDPAGTLVADLGVLDAGSHDVPLTGPVPPGARLELVARADAGAGRVTTDMLTIAPPAREETPTTERPDLHALGEDTVVSAAPGRRDTAARGPASIAAASLLAAVATQLGRHQWSRATPGGSPRPRPRR